MQDLLRRFEERFVRPKAGRTLIVGSKLYGAKEDRRARYTDVVGVDMLAGPGVDRVLNLEDQLPDDLGQFDHVECCSVLEHSTRPWMLAANIQALMRPGATIYFSVPFVWRVHDYPGDFFRYTDQGVRVLFPLIEWGPISYASTRLRGNHYLKAHEVEGFPYFPRCEVVGFGVRV